ncbi:MAG TPA: hypothetical protein VGK24_00385 [Candidatus Angelobacter sp.]|jgi:hypothetical protein
MTVVRYTELFRIECLHGYFGGAACRSLVLSPTDGCRALMERYRMLFRRSDGGARVYAPVQSPPDLLEGFDEWLPFTFTLSNTEAALNSYTDLASGESAAPAETLFHFDNSADYQAEVFGSRRQLLHPIADPFSGAAITVQPKLFRYMLPASASKGVLHVLEPLTGQVLWESPVQNSEGPFLLDLRQLPEGHYTLAMENQELLKFYLSDRPAAQQWGAISIYAGGSRQAPALPTKCRVVDGADMITPKTFTLALESRKTIWRYYVIDPAGKQDFGRYELMATPRKSMTAEADTAVDLRFSRLPDTVPIDGRTAWVFESQSPLPLLQSPSTEFSLMLRPNGNGKRGDRVVRLPYAQAGSLVFKKGARSREFCSEVFVYV